jgi:hypothetical protein
MTRMTTYLLAALIAAAPLSAAAQDRGGRGDRDRGDRGRPSFEQQDERPRISESEAQRIAQSRAGNARFVGSMGMRGGSYVFRFERDGRIIDIPVSAYR